MFYSIPFRGEMDIPTNYLNQNNYLAVAKLDKKQIYKRGRRSVEAMMLRRYKRNENTRIHRRLCRGFKKIKSTESFKLYQQAQQNDRGSGDPGYYFFKNLKKTAMSGKLINISKLNFISPHQTTNVGTFNTRTLSANWKKSELVALCCEKQISVLAIQEHRIYFPPCEEKIQQMNLGKGWTFYYSSASKDAVGGIGFILSPIASQLLDSITFISNRIMLLQISTQLPYKKLSEFKTTLINIYSPTSTSTESEITTFYTTLNNTIESIPKHKYLLILGDFNATLPNINRKTPIKKNRNTTYLQDFIDENNLVAANTLFSKPTYIHNTFYGPNKRKVCLDYALIHAKWLSSIQDINTFSPPSLSSDHKLMTITCKWKLSKKSDLKSSKTKDWSILIKDPDFAEEISKNILSYITYNTTSTNNHNDTSLYKIFTNSVDHITNKIPAPFRTPSHTPWINSEIISLRQQLKTYKIHHHHKPTPSSKEHLNNLYKQLADTYSLNRDTYIQRLCNQMENLHGDHQLKYAWNIINQLTGRKSKISRVIPAEDSSERLSKWRNHFQNLLSSTPNITSTIEPIPLLKTFNNLKFTTGPITLEELQTASAELSNHKATGIDHIPAEVLKLDNIHPIILQILNQTYSSGNPPDEWLTSLLIPVPKKGDLSQCTNYRGIALMSVTAKLFNRILLNRIRPILEPLLRINQNGFRPGRSTLQQVLSLRRLIERNNKMQDQKLIIAFIDFSKAFDSISWTSIESILLSYDLPLELVRAIMSLYKGAKAQVATKDGITEPFNLSVGVLQGDTLAPYIFIIVLDYIMRQAISDDTLGYKYSQSTIPNPTKSRYSTRSTTKPPQTDKYITDLDFADDIAVLSSSFENLQILINNIESEALKVGLKINREKTEYIVLGSKWNDTELSSIITVSSGPIKRVEDFKYLGSWLKSSAKDFEIRKSLAWKAATKLKKIWISNISQHLKLKIFFATIESILLYGCETWTITKTLQNRINGCYTKLLRYAYNISWKSFTSNEKLYGKLEHIDTRIKRRRLQFAGHCYRSNIHCKQFVSDLLFYETEPSTKGKFIRGKARLLTYDQLLLKDTDFYIHELKAAMLNKDEWRQLINKLK